MRGGRLEVVADSSHAALLAQLRAEEPLLSWIEDSTGSAEELMKRVATGEIDYTIADSHLFALLRHFYPDLRVAFSLGTAEPARVGAAARRGLAPREHRGVLRRDRGDGRARAHPRPLLLRVARVRLRRLAGVHPPREHPAAALPQLSSSKAERATGTDWRLLAAIAYQESHWNPGAVSPTGVRGMMMLTEHTAEMMEVDDRHDPRSSILGGAHYFSRVLRKIPQRIAEPDRYWLAVAAYNLGFGHLEDARILTQSLGASPDSWEQVRERLPLLSDEQWHRRVQRGYAPGQTAVTYVDNVRRYYEILMWMDSRETFTNQQDLPLDEPLPAG